MEENKEHHHEEIKHEHSVHRVKPKKKTNIWPYASLVLVVLLVISAYFNFSSGGITGMSTTEAGSDIVSFINNNLLQPGTEAELSDIKEVNGVYEVELDVAGQPFTSYVTKDGEIFFPQGYVLADLEELSEEAEVETTATEIETAAVKSDKPNVKMFVMTFCPYGQQAENGLGPALDVLGDTVEFEPHFVIYSNYCGWGVKCTDEPDERVNYCFDADEEIPQYCSMHGLGELNEGIRQLCIHDENPEKWWDYVNGINAECSSGNIDECWEDVAEDAGLDVDKIKACFDEKGELYLKKEVLLSKQYGVQGSPKVLVNDQSHSGGRAPENYKQSICNAFNEAPEECSEALSTTGAEAAGDCS